MSMTHGFRLAAAREIFVEKVNFIGPEEIEEILHRKVTWPPIRVKGKDLEAARDRGEMLMFFPPGITMRELYELRNGQTDDRHPLLYPREWEKFRYEPFFATETMRPGWRLVSREVLPKSTRKNYLDQTAALIEHMWQEKPETRHIPKTLLEASDEFNFNHEDLKSLARHDWDKIVERVASLKANREFRESPVEVFWSLVLYEAVNSGERLLPTGRWTWTNTLLPGGNFLAMGSFGQNGMRVKGIFPGYRDTTLGTRLSRPL